MLIMCSSLLINAQIKKGAVLLGGQISNYTNTSDLSRTTTDQKSTNGVFNISAGKAWKENTVWGLNLSYYPSSLNAFNNNTANYMYNKQKQYTAGIFYRQYKPLARNFYVFAQAGVDYTTLHVTALYLPSNSKETSTQRGGDIYLTPGISYNIWKKLQVEILIPGIVNVNYIHNANYNSFSFNTNLNPVSLNAVAVGFRFIL